MAQPLLWTLAGSPEFFIAHRAGPAELVAIALLVTWVPPTLLACLVWLAARVRPRAGEILLTAIVACHAAVFAAYACGQVGASSWRIALTCALAAAAAATIAWLRSAAVRSVASVLAFAAVAVPLLFLTRPSLRPILAGDGPVTSSAAGRSPRSAPFPVVLLVVDEMPLVSLLDADRVIDPVLYPNLAALAREGTWFRNATTVSDYTQWAVPAIVSGRYPRAGALPTARDYPQSLFTMLAPTHHVEAVEAITHICPNAICRQAPEPLGSRVSAFASDLRVVAGHVLLPKDVAGAVLPPITGDWAGFDKERRGQAGAPRVRREPSDIVLAFLDWISRDDPQPAFYYLHTLVPHSSHDRLPSGQRNATRTPIPADDRWTWTSDAWGVAQYQQRHLLQMAFMDRLVGRIIERLRSQGLYERSLFVVVADHGITFRPGTRRRTFSRAAAADIMRVPLIVKLPAGRTWPASLHVAVVDGQRVSDRNVETVDVAPTVADVLGLPRPWTSGTSLLDGSAERPTKRMFVESARRRLVFPAAGPDVSDSLTQKLALFGARGNPFRVPRPARHADLVGRNVNELRIVPGGGRVSLDAPDLFGRLDPASDEFPFDVSGSFERPPGPAAPAFVVVAVNGRVAAVTQTWISEPARWLATPPLDAWHEGANAIDVFVVDEAAGSPILRRAELIARPEDGS